MSFKNLHLERRMQKKKDLIIVLIIMIIILSIGAIAGILYIKTDFLKTDKQLFYKYLLEENKMLDMVKFENMENNMKSYIGTGEIKGFYEVNNSIDINENDKIAQEINENMKKLKKLQNITGIIETNVDRQNSNVYHKIKIKQEEEDFIDLELVRNEEKYAVKSKQITDEYVGIENKDLKRFLKKWNIENDEIIPDEMDFEKTYKTLTKINSDEKEHIFETYKEVLFQSINSENYTKQKNKKISINNNIYNTDSYTLTLSKAESIDILLKILQTLKQDSITLNMICNKIKVINPDSSIDISKLIEIIENQIEEVNKITKSDSEFIKINMYVDKKTVRKIDIVFESEKQILLEYEENNGKEELQISQNNIIDESLIVDFDIKKVFSNIKKIRIIKENDFTTYQFVMYNIKDMYKKILDNMSNRSETSEEENGDSQANFDEMQSLYDKYNGMDDDDTEVSFNIKNKKNNKNKAETSIYILEPNSKIGINILYEKNYTDNIVETVALEKSNSVMLNNYSKKNIENLLNAIISKGKNIIEVK